MPNIDITDMAENCKFGGDAESHPELVNWIWETLKELSKEDLANFYFFISGSTKSPFGGFKNKQIKITTTSGDVSKLPMGHTCFSELEIPVYKSKEAFRDKLLTAMSEGKEGFAIR